MLRVRLKQLKQGCLVYKPDGRNNGRGRQNGINNYVGRDSWRLVDNYAKQYELNIRTLRFYVS